MAHISIITILFLTSLGLVKAIPSPLTVIKTGHHHDLNVDVFPQSERDSVYIYNEHSKHKIPRDHKDSKDSSDDRYPLLSNDRKFFISLQNSRDEKNDKRPSDIIKNLHKLLKNDDNESKISKDELKDIIEGILHITNEDKDDLTKENNNKPDIRKHNHHKGCNNCIRQKKPEEEEDCKDHMNWRNHYKFHNKPSVIILRDEKKQEKPKPDCKKKFVFYIKDKNDNKDKMSVDIVKEKD